MIFRQLFDSVSSTYSYVLASRRGGEALIIDPVLEKVDRYLKLMEELDLRLVKAVDTHLHADHITGLGALRDRTRCVTVMGEQSKVDVVSMRIADGDKLGVEGLSLDVLYTPGHTDDSYSFYFGDRVFTGDTLLIRGTGRTDFQNGDSRAQYESLQRLLRLPEETLVFPAHDYKGDTVSTIGEEKRFNPRLQVRDADEYAALMASLNLPNPKMMDVAVPANIHQGLHQEEVARRGWAFSADEAKGLVGRPDVALIDLREKAERERTGAIPGSLHAPYVELAGRYRRRRSRSRTRRGPARRSSSTARSANVPRWRCRPPRTRASPRLATSRAARRRPRQHSSGLHQEEVARRGWAFSADEAKGLVGRPDVALIDLREKAERERTGAIPGSLHAPYVELQDNIDEGGLIHGLAASGRTIVFYCAFGERSAMAVQAAQDKGLAAARHIEGGMAAWKKAGGATR